MSSSTRIAGSIELTLNLNITSIVTLAQKSILISWFGVQCAILKFAEEVLSTEQGCPRCPVKYNLHFTIVIAETL